MSIIYDNWERLVRATLRREQLRLSGLRTPSDLSSVSASSSPFNLSLNPHHISSLKYRQILRATDYFSTSNLIKHGHSGDLYHGVLDCGIQVVVKKINLSSIDGEFYFMSELEIGTMVYHSRLISFMGHCLEKSDEKFLVYKHMPNRDLSSFLRREIVSDDEDDNHILRSLDWITRLKIAIGAAEGLCYLHHECFPPLVHRDIQASSILLDDDFEVRLGSLSRICTEEKDSSQNRIARFLWFPTGFEQNTSGTCDSRCAYDVYCFGKVLIELVTGRLGGSAVNDSTTKNWMANTLRYIVADNKKLILKIIDPSLTIDKHLLKEIWAVSFIAKACLNPKPSKRPQMAEILKALECATTLGRITDGNVQTAGLPSSVGPAAAAPITTVPKGNEGLGQTSQATTDTTSSDSSTASGNCGFLDAIANVVDLKGEILARPNLRIFTYLELKDATKNFRMDALLGEGEFGTVYKGSLHKKSMLESGSESLIAVKKLYSERIQEFQEWQSGINLLGRLSHPNLVKLLGCCWDTKEPLLVYEFMQRGSLDRHLFARDPVVQPLSWDIRLKILIGAARGLTFLHASQRQGFFYQKKMREGFYGYFEPSKIFLDDAYNAKISGFGVAKIDPPDIYKEAHPIKYERGSHLYAAPEYFLKGHLSVESDVYGFGVVLVQMLTGLGAYHPKFVEPGLLNLMVYHLTNTGKLEKIMDPRLKGKYPSKAAEKVAHLAVRSLQCPPESRPSMKQVVKILEHIQSANERPNEPCINSAGQTDFGIVSNLYATSPLQQRNEEHST